VAELPVTDVAMPRPTGGGDDRSQLIGAIAAQLGSWREATWIVEHGGPDRARALADRRAAGEPLQYVLGRWPFRSVELTVDPRVLVPRPETEQVVEVALRELARMSDDRDGPRHDRVCVDLGTGSGAIALSLALEGAPPGGRLEVWATDASTDALDVARENLDVLARLDAEAASRVRTVGGDWFGALPPTLLGRVDLVVSNPPYVGESDYPELDPTVRDWEPRGALVAGSGTGGIEGMAAIEAIIADAVRWLAPSGALIIEFAPSQAGAACAVARRAGFGQVGCERDLAGRLRMLVARW
jgi:release factor glutamine methyltransferase